MSNSTKPDWNVAIIDGQPQVVVNLAYVAKLINELPADLRTAKLRRMRRHLDEQHFNELSDMVVGGAR